MTKWGTIIGLSIFDFMYCIFIYILCGKNNIHVPIWILAVLILLHISALLIFKIISDKCMKMGTEKNYKTVLKLLSAIITVVNIFEFISCALILIIGIFGSERSLFSKIFDILLALFIGYSIFSIVYTTLCSKKFTRLLAEFGLSTKFIAEAEKELAKIKISKNKVHPTLLIADAYEYNGMVSKAIELTLSIPQKSLYKPYKTIYYNDLMYFYLMNNNVQMADRICMEGRPQLSAALNQKNAAIMHTFALSDYMHGNFNAAIEKFRYVQSQAPKDSSAFFSSTLDLARCYAAINQPQLAREQYNLICDKAENDYQKWRTEQLCNEIRQLEQYFQYNQIVR